MENYNVDKLIETFEAIPEEKWLIRQYTDKENGRGCAFGLLSMIDLNLHSNLYNMAYAKKDIIGFNDKSNPFIDINNGDNANYQQSTPKQRIIAALIDIKNKEEGDKAVEIVNEILKEEIYETV